ncbi:MAG: tetratricopeptide repeat protein [Planctomycetes bacterium]|nr:tetratricopeptide repeat protein [Planctomycetota bacterium]
MTQPAVHSSRPLLRALLLAGALFPPACASSSPTESEQHAPSAREAFLQDDTDRAELEAKLALQADPMDAEAHFLLGCLLARKGEFDQAAAGFQRTLALDPTHAGALYNLGTLLLLRGEALPAALLLESAVGIRPNHVPSCINLGKAWFLAGLPELSMAALEEALRLDPENPVALGNLLLMAEAGGLPEKAAEYLRHSAGTGPDRTAPGTPAAAGWPPSPAPASLTVAAAGSGTLVPELGGPGDVEAAALRDLLRDLPHVTVDRRADRLTLTGWTRGPTERTMLDRVLGGRSDVLDLTTGDTGDPRRMLEVDAVIFIVISLDSQTEGFNFLRLIDLGFSYFASDHERAGIGLAAPGSVGAVSGLSQEGWLFSAAVDYNVNIANATDLRVAVLARPHLTTLSGTPAKFLAGGELIFQVSGINSGDIKMYPFGTNLTVTPTLLRTPSEEGNPRVHVAVEAGRTSALQILTTTEAGEPRSFDKITVSSEAILDLNQTLILSGLSQRESRTEQSGVPILRSIPLLKYFFSSSTTVESSSAVLILLTPRDPAFWNERSQVTLTDFVAVRRDYIEARKGTPEDFQRFCERHPDWRQFTANRFASHIFLLRTSELYRTLSGADLSTESLELDLLDPN